jgi:hypothetical protein
MLAGQALYHLSQPSPRLKASAGLLDLTLLDNKVWIGSQRSWILMTKGTWEGLEAPIQCGIPGQGSVIQLLHTSSGGGRGALTAS